MSFLKFEQYVRLDCPIDIYSDYFVSSSYKAFCNRNAAVGQVKHGELFPVKAHDKTGPSYELKGFLNPFEHEVSYKLISPERLCIAYRNFLSVNFQDTAATFIQAQNLWNILCDMNP